MNSNRLVEKRQEAEKRQKAIFEFLKKLNPDNFPSKKNSNSKVRAPDVALLFENFLACMTNAGMRFDLKFLELISKILKEYYLWFDLRNFKYDRWFDLQDFNMGDEIIGNSNKLINPTAKFFFENIFIPILRKTQEWVLENAKKSEDKVNPKTSATKDEESVQAKTKIDIESIYNIFTTTILLIAKEVTNSKVSILFLSPDQVFLEAARMLKSDDTSLSDHTFGQSLSQPFDEERKVAAKDEIKILKKIRESSNYGKWSEDVSRQISDFWEKGKKDHDSNRELVSSEIPTYTLDWKKSDSFGDADQANATTQKNEKQKSDSEEPRMGITAHIAVNYEQYGKFQKDGPYKVNLNYKDIESHPAHLGKWDAVLWQGESKKCRAILAVPIKTSRLFIGILKVENPENPENPGDSENPEDSTKTNVEKYTYNAVEDIKSLSTEIGNFFDNYDAVPPKKTKDIINNIWTAHVLSRINQRTTQLLELLERGQPLRDNFNRVIGYILTTLKLIYGAQEGVHVLTGKNKSKTMDTEPVNCHVLDSFYPEYEHRIRGLLNRKGCKKCEICKSFVHSRIIDLNRNVNSQEVGNVLVQELQKSMNRVTSEYLSNIECMSIKDFEVWKDTLDQSTFKEVVSKVTFEFVPLLTQPKLLDRIDRLEKHNKNHEKDILFKNYPLCPISFECNGTDQERTAELKKVIVDHEKCQAGIEMCELCKTRSEKEEYESSNSGSSNKNVPYNRRALVFRLKATPYDFGIVILFFKEEKEKEVRETKIKIIPDKFKNDVTTAILNSVRILGKFLDSEYEDIKRFYIPMYRKPRVDKDVAILFADIRDYTRITKIIRMKNEFGLLEEMINEYYREMGNIIGAFGRVHQFLGDGIMAIFGEYETEDEKGKCRSVLSTVYCALQMVDAFKKLSQKWLAHEHMKDAQINEHIEPALGIGINFGRVRFNYFGGRGHREYSPIGDHVNFTQRLERMASRKIDDDDESSNIPLSNQGPIITKDPTNSPSFCDQLLGDIVVSKTVYDYLKEYLTDEARSKNPLRIVNVKSFSFDYPVYCPRRSDLDMAKISKELEINIDPMSYK
jgi:class 3 adenylate cyclase